MKKLALCAALVLAAPAVADEFPTLYMQGTAGYTVTSMGTPGNIVTGTGFGGDFGNGGSYGGGVGLKFPAIGPMNVRVDITGSVSPDLGGSNHGGTLPDGTPVAAKVKLQTDTYLANVYADLGVPGWPVTPFIGVGFGGAHNRVGSIVYSNPAGAFGLVSGGDKSSLAWSATVGAGMEVLPHVAFELAYRYIDAGKVVSGSNFTDLTQSPAVTQGLSQQISSYVYLHQFNATVRYLF